MADTGTRENPRMNCSTEGCGRTLEARTVIHTVRHKGNVIVIDHVPAEVCPVCGDVLLRPDTVRSIERLVRDLPPPTASVPLYEYV